MQIMRNIFFAIIILGMFVFVSPASAKVDNNSFLANLGKLVQEIFPGVQEILPSNGEVKEAPAPAPEEAQEQEEWVDPREVKQVLREIKDIRKELNRLAKQLKKLPNTQDDLNQINVILEQLANYESSLNQGTNLRDTIQDFREAQIWDQMNKIRAKIEIPKEMAQWGKEIKRLEKMLKQKKYQNLGLDIESAKAKTEEIKSALARVKEYYNGGDLEGAMEEFNDLREDFGPWDISNVLQRMWELMNRLKSVKDEQIKNHVKEMFGEVTASFNEGEYRIARELMDESFNEAMQIIQKALSVGKKKGYSKQGFFEITEKLEEKLKNAAEEKKAKMQEKREKTIEQPQEQVQPAPQPAPRAEQQIPTTVTPPAGSGGSETPANTNTQTSPQPTP